MSTCFARVPNPLSEPGRSHRDASQALVHQCVDAAKTLRVRAAAGTLLGRHLRLCPRAPALAHAPEERHILISIPRTNTTPPAHLCMLERRLTHLQLVSHTRHLALPPPLSVRAPTTRERRAPSTHFSERGFLIGLLDSEWTPCASGRGALREESRLEIARWESLELSLAHVVAGTLGVRWRCRLSVQRQALNASSHRFPALASSVYAARSRVLAPLPHPHTHTLPVAYLD
ncbi:hypothetical protein C8F04DRAFT_1397606 [Mycena alexandri]|uniref:Uncharacterized protein n=1 Tax=Mycena alexandri TaxID=1745969 RepID=A0AAD6SMZ6_9AGAR|nr:hypothetical protein C8F04DRAFT_1397606 [Mycena alexandri]